MAPEAVDQVMGWELTTPFFPRAHSPVLQIKAPQDPANLQAQGSLRSELTEVWREGKKHVPVLGGRAWAAQLQHYAQNIHQELALELAKDSMNPKKIVQLIAQAPDGSHTPILRRLSLGEDFERQGAAGHRGPGIDRLIKAIGARNVPDAFLEFANSHAYRERDAEKSFYSTMALRESARRLRATITRGPVAVLNDEQAQTLQRLARAVTQSKDAALAAQIREELGPFGKPHAKLFDRFGIYLCAAEMSLQFDQSAGCAWGPWANLPPEMFWIDELVLGNDKQLKHMVVRGIDNFEIVVVADEASGQWTLTHGERMGESWKNCQDGIVGSHVGPTLSRMLAAHGRSRFLTASQIPCPDLEQLFRARVAALLGFEPEVIMPSRYLSKTFVVSQAPSRFPGFLQRKYFVDVVGNDFSGSDHRYVVFYNTRHQQYWQVPWSPKEGFGRPRELDFELACELAQAAPTLGSK